MPLHAFIELGVGSVKLLMNLFVLYDWLTLGDELFKSINQCHPFFLKIWDVENIYILKYENRKVVTYLIKAYDIRRKLLYGNILYFCAFSCSYRLVLFFHFICCELSIAM